MGSFFVISPSNRKGEDGQRCTHEPIRGYTAQPRRWLRNGRRVHPPATPQPSRDSHVESGEPPHADHLASLRRHIP